MKDIKKEVNEEIKEDVKEEMIELTKEEVENMGLKLKEAEEKYVRAQADLVNYRKRKDEETSKMLEYANEDLILELLPSLDNFERAIKMNEASEDAAVKNINDGIKMIYNSLLNTLQKYGVKEIEALDKPFDASLHQAVLTETDETKEKEIILDVMQKGYILKNKVIRPSMVKVNK